MDAFVLPDDNQGAFQAMMKRQVETLTALIEKDLEGAPADSWLIMVERLHEQAKANYDAALEAAGQNRLISAMHFASEAWTQEQSALWVAERSEGCAPEKIRMLKESSETMHHQFVIWHVRFGGPELAPPKTSLAINA